MSVLMRLISDRRLSFTAGDSRPVSLAPRSSAQVLVEVRAQTTGRFRVLIRVETPPVNRGRDTIAETLLTIRSTAYNRLALFITVGAAVFLLGWWGRRFLPRRKS
jgi:hypothetical protein